MAQFPLLMNGVEVCTLEDLKKNFNPEDLVACRKRFAAWLKGWDYDEEAVEVKTLDQDLTDDQWLKAICGIIGISDQEFEAGLNKINEIKKEEQEKAEKKLAEEQQRKIEQVQKRKREPTPENIQVTIVKRHPTFSGTVKDVFVCEKGLMLITESVKGEQLYFSRDGEQFTAINPNNNSSHGYANLSYLNGYLIFRDNATFHFSLDGEAWNSFGFFDAVVSESIIKQYNNFHLGNIIFDDNKKEYVIFYSYSEFLDIRLRCASAKNLNGPWEDLGEFWKDSTFGKELQGFFFIQGKYIAEILNRGATYFGGLLSKDGIAYSEDGLNWKCADESDEWLDCISVQDGNRRIKVLKTAKGFFLSKKNIIPWKGVDFYFVNAKKSATIKASKEGYSEKSVSERCSFTFSALVCIDDKLLIFGENNEFATGEIQVK